ncbi:MAG: hypothetical protein WAM53_14455, partial [Terrimicrobiaceae bacterium]
MRPIAIASTSTAAFVGLSQMGPDAATLVSSWTEYQRYYGDFTTDSYLSQSVFEFFNNGGRQCYIVRVTRSDAVTANVTIQNRAAAPVGGVTFSAKSKGAWGNFLYLQIADGTADPGNEFKVSVRRQDDVAVVPDNFKDLTPLEVFDNLSIDPNDTNFVVNVLTQNSTLIGAQVLAGNTAVQRGIHRGGFAPTLPLGTKLSFQINLDNDGFQQVTLPGGISASIVLADVATAIQTAVVALTPKKASTPAGAFTAFTCTVETVAGQSRLILQSGDSATTSSVRIQAGSVN